MATVTWPQALPQTFQRSSYQETLSRNVISDPFEAGPAGLRRRCTKNVAMANGSMFMTTTEWELLESFLREETLDRELCFGFPAQGVTAESPEQEWLVLMNKPPSRTWQAEDFWLVTISFVVLPT
jgi:hypothetical protein